MCAWDVGGCVHGAHGDVCTGHGCVCAWGHGGVPLVPHGIALPLTDMFGFWLSSVLGEGPSEHCRLAAQTGRVKGSQGRVKSVTTGAGQCALSHESCGRCNGGACSVAVVGKGAAAAALEGGSYALPPILIAASRSPSCDFSCSASVAALGFETLTLSCACTRHPLSVCVFLLQCLPLSAAVLHNATNSSSCGVSILSAALPQSPVRLLCPFFWLFP